MADLAKSGIPSLATLTPGAENLQAGLVAGEAIAACDACYIKASDGKVWRAIGTALNAAARVRGFAWFGADVNEAVTLTWDLTWRYGVGLSPGADVYLGDAAGAIADAATTGGTVPIGYVVDATRIHLDRNRN